MSSCDVTHPWSLSTTAARRRPRGLNFSSWCGDKSHILCISVGKMPTSRRLAIGTSRQPDERRRHARPHGLHRIEFRLSESHRPPAERNPNLNKEKEPTMIIIIPKDCDWDRAARPVRHPAGIRQRAAWVRSRAGTGQGRVQRARRVESAHLPLSGELCQRCADVYRGGRQRRRDVYFRRLRDRDHDGSDRVSGRPYLPELPRCRRRPG